MENFMFNFGMIGAIALLSIGLIGYWMGGR